MTELAAVYQVRAKPSVAKNYSLTLEHIAKVSDMAQRMGVSQGEIVRNAIDLLWDLMNDEYTNVVRDGNSTAVP